MRLQNTQCEGKPESSPVPSGSRSGPWCSIPPVDAVSEPLNIASFFVDRHLTAGQGGRTAFRFAGRSITYGEVADQAARAAGVLAELGVDIEQRVLLALDDSPAFAAAFWGAARLGAVSVPVNPLMTPEDYAFLLNDSRARVAVVTREVAARL